MAPYPNKNEIKWNRLVKEGLAYRGYDTIEEHELRSLKADYRDVNRFGPVKVS